MKNFEVDNHAIEELLVSAKQSESLNDPSISAAVIAMTMPAVERVLEKTYPSFGAFYGDMVAVASRAIWKNALLYDTESDESFSVYMTPHIRKSIREYVSTMQTTDLLSVYQRATESEQAAIMEWVVANNERLVLHVINRHYSSYRHNHLDDMMQQGRMALFTNAPKFDPAKNYSFSTFITPYILDAIKTYICEVHDISPHYAVQFKKYMRARERLRKAGFENPTMDQIANEMGVGLDAVQKVFGIANRMNPISIEGDEKDKRLSDPYTDSPDKIVENQEFKRDIQRAINRLPKDQQDVVRATFFSDDRKDASLIAVSQMLGMDVSRVRKLLNKSRRELQYVPELRGYNMSREQRDLEDYTDSLMIDFVLPADAVEANLDIAMSLDLDF